VFCETLINQSSIPLNIHPLALKTLRCCYDEGHKDGSNQFIYSRFLTPFLSNFEGFSVFFDGDMIVRRDPAELLKFFNPNLAVSVVKHQYQTKFPVKYFGNVNEDYPRKNWSSVIVFNNAHPQNRILEPKFVQSKDGKFLHRFSWLDDNEIGELPVEWNWLVDEYDNNPRASLQHYTLGIPCISGFENCDQAGLWFEAYDQLNRGFELRTYEPK